MKMSNEFHKRERIVSQKLVDQLFTSGQSQSLAAFPLRAVYLTQQADCHQVLISVPKRRLRHAVDRNRVKRQLREAYRRHKDLLPEATPDGQHLAIAFVWLADSLMDTADVEQRMTSLLQRIAKRKGRTT